MKYIGLGLAILAIPIILVAVLWKEKGFYVDLTDSDTDGDRR